jgi:hypothetical protein
MEARERPFFDAISSIGAQGAGLDIDGLRFCESFRSAACQWRQLSFQSSTR